MTTRTCELITIKYNNIVILINRPIMREYTYNFNINIFTVAYKYEFSKQYSVSDLATKTVITYPLSSLIQITFTGINANNK